MVYGSAKARLASTLRIRKLKVSAAEGNAVRFALDSITGSGLLETRVQGAPGIFHIVAQFATLRRT